MSLEPQMGQNSHQGSLLSGRSSLATVVFSRRSLDDDGICFRLIQVIAFDKHFLP